MSQVILICLSLLILGSITNATYSDCGDNQLAQLVNVSIPGCDDTQDECELGDGPTFTISIIFETKDQIEKAYANVAIKAKKGKLPYSIYSEDICGNEKSGVSCPLEKDNRFTYKGEVQSNSIRLYKRFKDPAIYWRLIKGDVPKKYNGLLFRKKRELQSPNEIVCVKIPMKIKGKAKN